jgi:uncharacterized membrane protein
MKFSKQGEKQLYVIFIWSVLLKGFNGVLEIVGSFAFIFSEQILSRIEYWAQAILLENPQDLIANYFYNLSTHFSTSAKAFGFFYLLSHGVIKLFLAIALLKKKLWAYPLAIILFIMFIAYQLYRFTFTHSIFLIFLTILDIFVIWLTWHEYIRAKIRHGLQVKN